MTVTSKISSVGGAIVAVLRKFAVAARGLAVQRPPCGCRVVGGQHDQARVLLCQSENLARAFRESPPVAHARKLATLEDFRPVGEVPASSSGGLPMRRISCDTESAV
jgi:hypothetical protein